jgi:hypothetical protein
MRGLIWFLCLCLIVVVLAVSNPSKAEYVEWFKSEGLKQYATDPLSKLLIGTLGGPLIESYTSVQNYVVFSVFRTSLDSRPVMVVGVLHNFIPLSKIN